MERHLGKYAAVAIDSYLFILYDLHFIRMDSLDTLSVCVSERRAEIHYIEIFVGHLGRRLGKYATVVIDFYIFIFYHIQFI